VTIDPDQLRALAVLRYWLGPIEVLAVVEQGSGDPIPGLAGQQLALALDDPPARVDPAVQPGSSRPGCGRRRA
jgi:hypothetical protein